MGRPPSYPKELRERAVRMVLETKAEYPTEFNAITSIRAQAGDRVAGDAAQVGPAREDRFRAASRDHERGVGADQGAQAGERRAAPGE
jgi:transposase-like protein